MQIRILHCNEIMPKDDDAGERRRKGKEEVGSGKREKAFI
jgi:hypothetical protein